MDKYEMIEKDVIWVLQNYGSDAEEQKNPGSKIKSQASRIAEFIRQLDEAEKLLTFHKLNLINITSSAI